MYVLVCVCLCVGLHVHVWVGSLACLAVNIIGNLSLLIVAGLGLCKVCIGLSGNSIHTITYEFYQCTHTHTHNTYKAHTHTKHIYTYIQMYKRDGVNGI